MAVQGLAGTTVPARLQTNRFSAEQTSPMQMQTSKYLFSTSWTTTQILTKQNALLELSLS